METSVKAAEVLVPPQPDVASSPPDAEQVEAPPPTRTSPSDFYDPMEEFSRRLEDIISTYGAAATQQKGVAEVEVEVEQVEAKDDITAAMETEVSAIMQRLNTLSTPEEKLDCLLRKYSEVVAGRCSHVTSLSLLQQRFSALQQVQQQLQVEQRSSLAARGQLERLCRELQQHYGTLREETLRRRREDEDKRTEMTSHFQTVLTEIQAQIEQHSVRNDKLCHENACLTDKLESLMGQCERREESLEKIGERRDLQNKLTEAKLQQANALLQEAEEKHKREKEYLLREAIEKTKKCFAMKEQELTMKKKLTLYAQKFDEFQETLAKSNEIYVRFKKEMDNMSDRMKKMDKESNLWKTRFENCNKALTDMIDERAEKNQEYEVFVLKIQKLEKLCRALQEERVILYAKIKEVRQANSDVPKALSFSKPSGPDGADASTLLTPADLQELQQLQEEDPVLTRDMARLREEQAKLQQFADSLLSTPSDHEDEEEDKDGVDGEDDMVASAFVQFQTKPEVKKEPEQLVDGKPEAAEPVPPQSDKDQETKSSKPEAVNVQTQESKEVTPVQPEEIQQQPAEPEPEPEPAPAPAAEPVQLNPPADPKPEAAEAPLSKPVDGKKVQQAAQVPGGASSKQTAKKKKKRSSKNAS